MPIGSPLQGFNHNIRHNGRQYHVQTEDSGSKNPHVFTHLYHGGVVIATMKFEYDDLTKSDATYDKQLRKMMQNQHKAIMKTLRAGEFDEKISQIFGDIQTDMAGAMAVETSADEHLSVDEVISKPQPIAVSLGAPNIEQDEAQLEGEFSDTPGSIDPGTSEATKTLIVLKDKATRESSSAWRYVAPRAKHRAVRRVTYGIKPISGGFIANPAGITSVDSSNAHGQAIASAPTSGGKPTASMADRSRPSTAIPPSDDSRSLDQVILDYLADDDV